MEGVAESIRGNLMLRSGIPFKQYPGGDEGRRTYGELTAEIMKQRTEMMIFLFFTVLVQKVKKRRKEPENDQGQQQGRHESSFGQTHGFKLGGCNPQVKLAGRGRLAAG